MGWLIGAVLQPPGLLVMLAAVAFVICVGYTDPEPAGRIFSILLSKTYLILAAWGSRHHKRSRIGTLIVTMLIAYVVAWPLTHVILAVGWLLTFH